MYTDPSDQSIWLYHAWLIEQGELTGHSPIRACELSCTILSLTAPSVSVLQREMKLIEELLELEPDSKCEFLIFAQSSLSLLTSHLLTGCMHALATYSTLLLQQLSEADQPLIDSLHKRAKELFEKLVEVDEDRAERYRDLITRMQA